MKLLQKSWNITTIINLKSTYTSVFFVSIKINHQIMTYFKSLPEKYSLKFGTIWTFFINHLSAWNQGNKKLRYITPNENTQPFAEWLSFKIVYDNKSRNKSLLSSCFKFLIRNVDITGKKWIPIWKWTFGFSFQTRIAFNFEFVEKNELQ